MKKINNIVERNKAPLLMRFLNSLIDKLVVYSLFFLFGIFAVLILKLTGNQFFYDLAIKLGELNRFQDLLLTSFIYFMYCFSMENFTKGRTIGKYFTGTKAINTDGTIPTTQEFLVRNLCRLIPFDSVYRPKIG